MRFATLIGTGLIFLLANSCISPQKRDSTSLPNNQFPVKTLGHLLLDSEKYSLRFTPDEKDYKTIDRFLDETRKACSNDNNSEEQAKLNISRINEIIRRNYLKEVIRPNEEAIKVTLFSEGVKEKKGHCFHHVAFYTSAGQELNLPLSVYYAPQIEIKQNSTNKLLYGHVFMRWNFPTNVSNGTNYIVFEAITGEVKPLNYYNETEGVKREISLLSLDGFTDWAVKSRLDLCSSEIIGKEIQTKKTISRSLRTFFGERNYQNPNNLEANLLYQRNGGK